MLTDTGEEIRQGPEVSLTWEDGTCRPRSVKWYISQNRAPREERAAQRKSTGHLPRVLKYLVES